MVIKTLNVENPFADYGNIVEGNRFVGRKTAIHVIHSRVLGTSFGNLAIVGLPRIGKSSLAWNALMVDKKKYETRKILIERIDISSIKSIKTFYLRIMDKTLLNIKNLNVELYQQLLDTRKSFNDTNDNGEIEFFFALVKQNAYRLVYILDEFDKVRQFFKLEDFQLLRELSISPETKICLVTISRRTIRELEPDNGAISNFFGVFADLRLGMFDNKDIQMYWDKITSHGIEITDEYQQKVDYLVGKHPYLMDILNFNIFMAMSNDTTKTYQDLLDETESKLRLNLYSEFESALSLLKAEGLYSKTFQFVLGPFYDANSIDEQKLLKYEFIKEVSKEHKLELLGSNHGLTNMNKNVYICFSPYFTQYFKLKQAEINYWPLWEETENKVRRLIKTYLEEKYAENWEIQYLSEHPSPTREKLINDLKEVREKYQKKFSTLASNHIVDYTYPKDMYDLFISTNWNWFGKIFGDGKKKWAEVFGHLSEIRNPIAHNNSQFVPTQDIDKAKRYCEDVLEKINNWRKSLEVAAKG